ncbi:YscR/HrcR family type III secretion apparatus protein [Chlamydia pecorum MC/MarsBar]|uniref:type III secretion system export apparatus subunit SctR n=1 Tax=Chlamydia pecorum TaxID=85991 RepID=UPI0003D3FE27|nr:type III secretion system export apparatus subunit SctR [Chlamydia pecorum]ETF38587.1 YscR/HrcR family type III secretion apparatus protein [Chlamydia pecorum VR629]ETF39092.1 YscR/HrcR family type III secretion apparatus protein [Chlamydia pecorum DBDeUG]ETF39768.1 YscR/HrcR family type III secretion apparatus protein [Chlamydia pecorum MC/MarsBar]ETF40818.1 YscR/HrcR family type III secretion apparatus protein [Chlamydia pecorum IPTaLE]UBV31775.1 type III secretion apparatus protein, YscR
MRIVFRTLLCIFACSAPWCVAHADVSSVSCPSRCDSSPLPPSQDLPAPVIEKKPLPMPSYRLPVSADDVLPREGLSEGSFSDTYPDLTTQAVILIFLALSPFLVMLLTSYLKIIITLVLLRNALGVQQTPPSQVLNGIALILSIYVMFPTGAAMYKDAKKEIEANTIPRNLFTAEGAETVFVAFNKSKEPLRNFLIRNTPKSQIQSFYKISQKTFPAEIREHLSATDFVIVIPAFIMGQIKNAFEIGVMIYLPFFVIDLVTANILVAMQMMMLSPLSISLPLKLLLVVMVDGWTLLLQGLMISFK